MQTNNINNSRLTLIIDGNWLLMSRLYAIGTFNNGAELSNSLMILLTQSIKNILKLFPDVDNIIFVSDEGSWRSNVDIPDFLKKDNIEYKGTRQRSDDIDWDLVFKTYEKYCALLKMHNITVCREPEVEGDDWIWYWSNRLHKNNTNVIIWSTDRDLTQLIKTDNNSCFVALYNKKHKLICEEKVDQDFDFLFNPVYNLNDQILRNAIKRAGGAEYIHPKYTVVDKIVRGDASDNILPIVTRTTASGKEFKVANKDIPETLDIDNEEAVKQFICDILNKKLFQGNIKKSASDIFKHFEYNKRLIVLDEKNYPEHILEKLKAFDNYSSMNKDILPIYESLLAKNNSLTGVLETI